MLIFLWRISLPRIGSVLEKREKKIYDDIATAKELQEDFNDQSLYGLIAGSGVEYFFAKDFSLGGEFSMNLFVNSWERERGGDYYYNEEETIKRK